MATESVREGSGPPCGATDPKTAPTSFDPDATRRCRAPARRWHAPAAIVVIGLCTLLAYSNSFQCGFTRDDHLVIEQDKRLHAFTRENVSRILRHDYWWNYSQTALYRPVTSVSFMLEWSVFGHGNDPTGYHWTNFFLHWINGALVFLVARRLTARLSRAFISTALFALHPVATEAVTYVVGRADELAALGILAGYLCYMKAAEAPTLRRAAWLGGVAVSAFFAMFSKESGAAFVAVLILHEWAFRSARGDDSLANLVATCRRSLPAIAICAPAVLLWAWKHHALARVATIDIPAFTDNPIAYASQPQALLTATKVLGRYLGLLVLPRRLSTDYSYDAVPLYGNATPFWEDLQSWIGLAFLVIPLALAWRCRRAEPSIAFGIAAFFALLLPTSNVVVPIGSIMAERFLYTPLWAFCLVAAPALLAIGNVTAEFLGLSMRAQSWVRIVPTALVLGSLGLRTFARNADYVDDYTLFRSAVQAQPESFRVHLGLALETWKRQKDEATLDAAIARAEIGLAVLDARPLPVSRQSTIPLKDLGTYYTRKAEFLSARNELGEANRFHRKAVDVLVRASAIDTYSSQAHRRRRLSRGLRPEEIIDVANPEIYNTLAVNYVKLEQWDEGAKAAHRARQLNPIAARSHALLGTVNFALQRFDEATVNVIQAILSTPDDPTLWARLEELYSRAGIQPAPIVNGPSGPQLDITKPAGRAGLSRACNELFHLLHEANMHEAAETLRTPTCRWFSLPSGAAAHSTR